MYKNNFKIYNSESDIRSFLKKTILFCWIIFGSVYVLFGLKINYHDFIFLLIGNIILFPLIDIVKTIIFKTINYTEQNEEIILNSKI